MSIVYINLDLNLIYLHSHMCEGGQRYIESLVTQKMTKRGIFQWACNKSDDKKAQRAPDLSASEF